MQIRTKNRYLRSLKTLGAVKNPWGCVCEALNLKEPRPRLHDLRHTWKTNARPSDVDPEIREIILGHCNRTLSVSGRHGRISSRNLYGPQTK